MISALPPALLLTAAIHAAVVPEHAREWPLAGAFFAVLAVVQWALAIAVMAAWGRAVASVVVLVDLATVAVWLVSRTAGLPFGPAEMRGPEPVGVLDVVCCVVELVVVALCAASWPAPHDELSRR